MAPGHVFGSWSRAESEARGPISDPKADYGAVMFKRARVHSTALSPGLHFNYILFFSNKSDKIGRIEFANNIFIFVDV